MTKKDYFLIAKALQTVRLSYGKNWSPELFRACDDHIVEFIRVLSNDNPNFDKQKFLVVANPN